MCDAYLFLTEKVYDAGLRKHQLACAVVAVQSLGIVFVVGDRVQRPSRRFNPTAGIPPPRNGKKILTFYFFKCIGDIKTNHRLYDSNFSNLR